MLVKAKNVDTAARTAGVEDDSVALGSTGEGEVIGREFAVRKGVEGGRTGGHEKKDEGDEEERDRNHQDYASEAVDLVGERLVLPGALHQHLVQLIQRS